MENQGGRVLLVEDEPMTARATARMLRQTCAVTWAATAAQARGLLASVAAWRAFIFDDGLPDGSGLDVLCEWRTVYPETPALVLTACTEPRVINAAFDLRAEYLVKPVEPSRVLRFLLHPGPRTVSPAPLVGGGAGASRDPDATPLEGCIDRFRELQQGPQDARVHYRMGVIVAQVRRRPDVYGPRGVAMLAASVGAAVPNLYRCATVAERWTEPELEGLLSRTRRDGQPLSWSHLVVLASIEGEAARAMLLERVLSGSLSVRALMAFVQRDGDGSDPVGDAGSGGGEQ